MTLTRGTKALFPCPVCLIPNSEQNRGGMWYPSRDVEEMKAAVLNQTETATAKEAILKGLGLRNVHVSLTIFNLDIGLYYCLPQNVFWDLPITNVYRLISFDELHANDIGLFGKHLWPQFLLALKNAPREVRVAIDVA